MTKNTRPTATPTKAQLLARVAELEAAAKAAAATPTPSRFGPMRRRRAVGTYWNHPQGSMQFQNDFLDANQAGFLTPDPKGTELFTFKLEGKDKTVKCRRVHLTDRELMAVFNAEYDSEPTKAVVLGMVRVIRDMHNTGSHGKYDVAPKTPVSAWDANGNEVKGSAPKVASAR